MTCSGGDKNEEEISSELGKNDSFCMSIEEFRLSTLNNLKSHKISVITEGLIIVGGQSFQAPSVLIDTGATHHNYISPEFSDKLASFIPPDARRSLKGGVTLGDAQTKCPINEELRLRIRFWDPGGFIYEAILDFQVFKSGHDIIIGYPAIVDHFIDLLISLLRKGRALRKLEGAEFNNLYDVFSFFSSIVDIGDCAPKSEDLIPAWAQSFEESLEEKDIMDPVQFESALYFLTVSKEEALSDFNLLLDSHVSEEMKKSTEIIKLLHDNIQAWIPENWEGIRGIPDLELRWREDLLSGYRSVTQARHISPRLYDNAAKEFARLRQYHYTQSTSPVTSPLVIAPKATPPFIRFCGDYIKVNNFIETHHGYIPVVEYEIQRIKGYKIYADIDLANAFHQIRLGPITSDRLSVVTPWGQFKPVFMPEGVAPASIILQDVMREIFIDFEWVIAIFDNILLLASDEKDLYSKLEMFLHRCVDRNIVLKMAKSFIGFREVKFFGYNIRHDSYELGEDRKQIIERLPFPQTVKATQSFLGISIFFQKFVPHYSSLIAPLYEMTKQNFNWDKSTWKLDYKNVFEEAKKVIISSLRLYFPDYNLQWIMRTDASIYGVGGVLLQVFIDSDGVKIFQPIAFVSKKFSETAVKWATIQQECYGIYYTIHKLQYYLRGKFFELETDHANLQWMEASDNPLIIRMRVFVQGFLRVIRHIPKAHNKLADFFSRYDEDGKLAALLCRLCCYEELNDLNSVLSTYGDSVDLSEALSMLYFSTFTKLSGLFEISDNNEAREKISETCKAVHNSRMGHMGARRTWLALNKHFPGHGLSFSVVEDFVMSCPVCQKDRLRMANSIPPMYRTVKQEHMRRAIGVDNLDITPVDEYGNAGITVIVNLASGLTGLYPYKVINSEFTALAIFQYICDYGLVDEIHSDPGKDLKSKMIASLNSYLGMQHVFSLVDRHQSNGVERVIGEILRHLRALVYEERLISKWSSPTVLPVIKYILNSSNLSERGGYTAYELTYGMADQSYFMLKDNSDVKKDWSQFVKEVDSNLKLVREASLKFQASLVTERSSKSPSTFNHFKAGDLVTRITEGMRSTKLTPKFRGPYEVIDQTKNDVKCKNLATGAIEVLDLEKIQLFIGSKEEAMEAATWDADQYVVDKILAHRGDPWHRTTMEFLIVYSDGDQLWQRFNTDNHNISKTIIFEDYCRSKPELFILLLTDTEARKHKAAINKKRIVSLKPGDHFFLDIRLWGWQWYDNLDLPDKHFKTYLTECQAIELGSRDTKIKIYDKVFKKEYWFQNFDVISHCYRREISDNDILITQEVLSTYPQILNSK